MINELFKKGAEVIYERLADVHVSGHACQEELKLMLALTKPKYFVPIHGEYRHLRAHAEIAKQMGVAPKNVLITDIGKPVEITEKGAKLGSTVQSGKVLVDGLGVGDVGSVVLRDRKHLAEDGLITVVVTINNETGQIIAGPDIVSRGFIYVKEAEDLMEELQKGLQRRAHLLPGWEANRLGVDEIHDQEQDIRLPVPEDQAESDDSADYHGNLGPENSEQPEKTPAEHEHMSRRHLDYRPPVVGGVQENPSKIQSSFTKNRKNQ